MTRAARELRCSNEADVTRSWTKGLALSSLASAALLGVACGESNSSSGGQGHVSDAATDVGTPDAPPSEDAPTSDAPDAACSGGGAPDIGPLNLTFDQEIAYLCSESDASAWLARGQPRDHGVRRSTRRGVAPRRGRHGLLSLRPDDA